MMLPGGQTVTVRNYVASGVDRLNQPIRIGTDTVVDGCAMQPQSVSESVSLTDVETEMWKLLAPPVAAVVAATTTSEVVYSGMVFQVLGTRPVVDLIGVLDHMAIDLKKQIA